VKCSAITRAGGRCRLDATHGSFCYQHSPDTVEERRRNASRAGRSGGNGRPGVSEIVQIKREIRGIVGGVLSGRIERRVGGVALSGYNILLRAVEVERRVAEVEAFEERVAELEAIVTEQKHRGGRRSRW
jgi:hypothetical protein